jgi:farnesyl-diphosphate farnesyltransferase
MNGPLSLSLRMVVSFVMLDFALEQRWAVAGCFLASWGLLALLSSSSSGEHKVLPGGGAGAAASKQGGYGKVVVFKESVLTQLSHPSELLAMVRCKLGALGARAGESGESVLGAGGVRAALGLSEADLAFCEAKLVAVSRSFAQVITFLPNSPAAPLRLAVGVFYLVLRALDTVEDDMDLGRFDGEVLAEDRALGQDARLAAKIRLLRGFARRLEGAARVPRGPSVALLGFGEGAERELVERLDVLVRVLAALPQGLQADVLAVTDEMGCGMAAYIARDLRNGTEDAADFERYCHIAAGTVGDGLTRLFVRCGFAPQQLVLRRDLWDSMGSLLQRVNIIRDYLEDLVDGRAWWPRSVWERYVAADFGHTAALSALADPFSIQSGASTRCLAHMVADALELVPNCLAYLDMVSDDPAVLSFCALPQVMAIATLNECLANPHVFQGVCKIRKGQAAKIMLDLAPLNGNSSKDIRKATLVHFDAFLHEMRHKAEKQGGAEADRVQVLCDKLLLRCQQGLAGHSLATQYPEPLLQKPLRKPARDD